MTRTTAANPLLQIQFQIPFDQIRAENVEPAIDELLQEARAELDSLTSEPGPQNVRQHTAEAGPFDGAPGLRDADCS